MVRTIGRKCPKFTDFHFVILYEGAIELAILAEYYGREIAAYDIQTTRCDLYGQVSVISGFSLQMIIVKVSQYRNFPTLFIWDAIFTGNEVF